MKLSDTKLPRLLTASAFALLCFCLGYLAPHQRAALAQTPYPTSSIGYDDVPGGGHGNGGAIVTNAMATQSALLTASKSGWACAKSSHCAVSLDFRTARKTGAAPKPFTCPILTNCFSFTGNGFTYVKENPSGQPIETVSGVQIAGMFQLRVTR